MLLLDMAFGKLMIFLVSLILLPPQWAMARGACQSVDLHSSPDSPLRQIPISDQNGAGICYAEVASLVIDFERLRLGENVRRDPTDPVYLAYLTKVRSSLLPVGLSLEGGLASHATDAYREFGGCTSKVLDQAYDRLRGQASLSQVQLLALIQDLESALPRGVPPTVAHAQARESLAQQARASQKPKSYRECDVHQVSDNWVQEFELLKNASAARLLDATFAECREQSQPVNPQLPRWEHHHVFSNDEVLGYLDSELSLGRPVSIGLCAQGLRDSNFFAFPSESWPRSPFTPERGKDCSPHAVAIVGRKSSHEILGGRRDQPEACWVLVRNSWGANWRGNGAQACACWVRDLSAPDGKRFLENCPPRNTAGVLEVVGCWYPSENLARNIHLIETQKPKR